MSQIEHKKCFGTMLPDTLHIGRTEPNEGKVFTVKLVPCGGANFAGHFIEESVEEWDDCRACSEFDSCYKFCIAKASLRAATGTH